MIFLVMNLLAILANSLIVNGECQCGIFLMTESVNSALDEVYLSTTHVQACDRLELDQLCRDFCYQKFLSLTAGGILESTSSVFNMSSGEMFCKNLQQEVDHREVGGYYRWCQASWKFVGIKTAYSLCCTNSSYIRCEDDVSNLATSTEPMLVARKSLQPETTQTVEAPAIPSDKSDDSQNETSPKCAIRKKRNPVHIIQARRKFFEKSIGSDPKASSKLKPRLPPHPKRSVPESAQDPILAVLKPYTVKDVGSNANTEATVKTVAAESKNWSQQVNATDWIPMPYMYLRNELAKETNETRPKGWTWTKLISDLKIRLK